MVTRLQAHHLLLVRHRFGTDDNKNKNHTK